MNPVESTEQCSEVAPMISSDLDMMKVVPSLRLGSERMINVLL